MYYLNIYIVIKSYSFIKPDYNVSLKDEKNKFKLKHVL